MIKLYRKLQEYGVSLCSMTHPVCSYIHYTFTKGKCKCRCMVSFDGLEPHNVSNTEQFLLEKLNKFVETLNAYSGDEIKK